MIKKLVTLTLMSALALASSGASAKEGDKSAEVSLNYGTESFDGLGGQWGVRAGFGYEFRNNLQGRVDLSYFRSSTSESDMDVTGTRVPLDLGVRYYYPLSNIDSNLAVYGQGGVEISFDEWHPGPGERSRNETRFGALIGGGAQYALDPQWSAIAHLEYHVIQNSYFSTGIGMAYRF